MSHPVNHSPIVHDAQTGRGTGLPSSQMNTSVVAVEQQRAIAEAEGQLTLAKKFPRNFAAAMEEIMTSCSYMEFAEEAFYALPRGGQTVRGPSIRMAEEIARCYGNFQYGHRELARNEGESVVEVFAWDMERNNRSVRQITIPHIMDTRQGGKKLVGQKEISDYIANIASKQMRSRILALLPKPLVAAAIKRCEQTLAGTGEQTVQQRLEKMMQSFSKYGVTVQMLEMYLGHPLSNTTTDEITDLIAVFTAIKDGQAAKDFFTLSTDPVDDESSKNVKGIIDRNNAAAAASASQKVNTKPIGETLVKPEPDAKLDVQAGNDAAAAETVKATPDKSAKKGTGTGTGKKNDKAEPKETVKPQDNAGVETVVDAGAEQNTVQTQQPDPTPEPEPEPEPQLDTPEPEPEPEPQPEPAPDAPKKPIDYF